MINQKRRMHLQNVFFNVHSSIPKKKVPEPFTDLIMYIFTNNINIMITDIAINNCPRDFIDNLATRLSLGVRTDILDCNIAT